MNTRKTARVLLIAGSILLALTLTPGTALAQQVEIHPYAGWFDSEGTDFRSEGIYGVRGGVYLIDFVQLDANFGYINNFNAKNTVDSGVHAYIWDLNTSFSLRGYNIPYTKRVAEPFLTIGAGGLTTNDHVTFTEVPLGPTQLPTEISPSTITTPGGGTFFAFNYGAGLKTVRMWGPFGLRVDFRGRTIPNYHGGSLTWFEATGGFNIMWGER
jgi:hypothetical protein